MDGPSEDTRYLASYIAENWWQIITNYGEGIDADALATLIDRYYKELP